MMSCVYIIGFIIVLFVIFLATNIISYKAPYKAPYTKPKNQGCYYADTILELYPNTDYSGWDDNGNALVDGTPVSMEDVCVYKNDKSETKSEIKSIVFCKQRGGVKTFLYKSFRVDDSQMLMIRSSVNNTKGFMIGRQNIPNIDKIFDLYPELSSGDWNNKTQDMDFEITCLDDTQIALEACLTSNIKDCEWNPIKTERYTSKRFDVRGPTVTFDMVERS